MDAPSISLHLDPKDVSVDELLDALSAQTGLIRCVLGEMGIPTEGLRWIVRELHAGSAGGAFEAQLPTASAHLFAAITAGVDAAGRGVEMLEQRGVRPPWFNDRALAQAQKLADIASRGGTGKSRFTFGTIATSPNRHTAANVAQLVEPKDKAIGSLEGTLIGFFRMKRGYSIYLSSRLYGDRIKCDIPMHLRDAAVAAIEKRVIVRGFVWTTSNGTVAKIEARAIEALPSDEELPRVAQMAGYLRDFDIGEDE